MTGFLRTAWLVLALSACASLPLEPSLPPAEESFALNGRVLLSGTNGALSGGLRWEHQRDRDMLMLSTPTGQGLAQLVRAGEEARLTTPEGSYTSPNSEALTARLFGAPLPLEALSQWVLGRGTGSRAWSVEVLEFRDQGGRRLPARLLLRASGAELRLVIDEWSRLP